MGYASYKRTQLFEKLKLSLCIIINKSTGIAANLSKRSLDKMTSAKAIEKSKSNGFTLDEHFELAERIVELYRDAVLAVSHPNLKNPDDPNVISIKRFICQTELCSGKAADTLITIKESIANGHRIYSIELYEINKASDRFRGLCDAADNSGQGN